MKKSNVILGVALALFFSLVLSSVLYAQEAYDLARRAYANKNWSDVVKYSKQVVDEYPDWFFGHYLLSKGYIRLGQEDNAIRSANRAMESSENNDQSFMARYTLAEAYYKKGDFKNAADQIDKIYQRYKNASGYAKASSELSKMDGFSKYSLGNYRGAISAFQPLVSSGKASADVLRAVAKSYQEVGQNKQSIEVISQVVRKDPNDINAHKILIKSYLNDKQYSKSLEAANAALTNFQRDAEIHYLMGAAYKGLGQYGPAESELKRSLTLRSDDKTRRLLGDVLMAQGKFADAAKEFSTAQGSFRSDPKLFYNIAYCWANYVPKDAQNYKGKQPEERNFFQALDNAKVAIDHAAELGMSQDKVADLKSVIDNKWERLDKGAIVEVEVEVTIDPETGEVIRTEKPKDKK